MKKNIGIILFCCLSGIIISCASRSALRLDKLMNATVTEDYASAIKAIQKKTNLYGNLNKFLYYMDIGALYHYAKEYDSSTAYLLNAAEVYQNLFTRSVTNEAAAVLVNDNLRPYRSRPYELSFLHQLLSFNYLAKGDVDGALVETRRAQLLFDEWERKDKRDVKYTNDPMFHYISSIAYDAAGEADNSMISLYKAVEAFKNGPVLLPDPIKNYAYYQFIRNDRADDNNLLKLSTTMPQNSIDGLGNNISEIICIGYAGRGPALDEMVWWGTWVKDGLMILNHTAPDGKVETMTLTAPALPEEELKKAEKGKKTKSGTTFHIKLALPAIKKFPSQTDHFIVKSSALKQPERSIVINNFEKQVEKNLEDTKAVTMARTAIRVVLRTISAEKAKKEIQTNNAVANLLLNVGTDILTDQMEHADARSCFLIPKEVHIMRIPVDPGTWSIDVDAVNKNGTVIGTKTFDNITVKPHEKKFVFYSSFK